MTDHNSTTEHFIEAAVRPLGDNAEMQMMAAQELRHMMGVAGETEPLFLEEALQRIEKSDLQTPRKRWRQWLHWTALLAFLITALFSVRHALEYWNSIKLIHFVGGGSSSLIGNRSDNILKGKTPQERLLLFGDLSKDKKSQRLKALWESDPDNVSYYIDYAAAYIQDYKVLPEDFIETGTRLDPQNAWFPAIAAADAARHAVIENSRTEKEKRDKVARSFTLKDPAKFEEAMALLSKAAAMPRYESYQHDLSASRLRLLPPRRDSLDQVSAMTYAVTLGGASTHPVHLNKAVHAACDLAARENDLARLRKLTDEWNRFALIYARAADVSLVDALLKTSITSACYQPMRKASEALGLTSEAEHAKQIIDGIAENRKKARQREAALPGWKRRASFFAALALPAVAKAAPNFRDITDKDLKPGRWAEHEFLGKGLFAVTSIMIAALTLITSIYPLRGTIALNLFSNRIVSLMGPLDWTWVLGTGSLLPLLLYHVASRLPWTGGREVSIYFTEFRSSCCSFAFLVSLLVIAPIVVSRWRLGKAAGFMGARWRRTWLAWGVLVLPALSLPFAAAAMLPGYNSTAVNIIVVSILLLAYLWFFMTLLCGLFGRNDHVSKRIALSKVVLSAYATSLLLCCLSVILCHSLEKRWMQREHLLELSAEEPAMCRFEYQITQSLHADLLEILEKSP